MLNLCYEFSLSNNIIFNPIKSQCMVFKPNRFKLYCPAVYLNGNIIDYVAGASPGFGRGGGQEFFFFRFGNLHVAKRHAAHGEAMRIARGVRGHAPPRKFF